MAKVPKDVRQYLAKLGKKGGKKGGPARAQKLSSKERSDIARRAARKRWKFRKH